MSRKRKLAGVALLILSWVVVAGLAIVIDCADWPFSGSESEYDFGSCPNDDAEWCDAYFAAVNHVWEQTGKVQGGAEAVPMQTGSDGQLTLVVVDRFSEGMVVYEMDPMPNGECPPGPAMEIVVHLSPGEGPASVETSTNENCEIVIDEIR